MTRHVRREQLDLRSLAESVAHEFAEIAAPRRLLASAGSARPERRGVASVAYDDRAHVRPAVTIIVAASRPRR
ncbi:hypothetical protein [Sphingomonas faeni]|uniref:hypothetical protein n=1 Tax=Sphingomonas faeni TaxID=185950 RepID=UPI003353C0CA